MGNQCCVASNEAGGLDFTTPYDPTNPSPAERLRKNRGNGEPNNDDLKKTPDAQDTKLTELGPDAINERNLHKVNEPTKDIKRGEIGEKGNMEEFKMEDNFEETGVEPTKKVRAGNKRKGGNDEPVATEEERNEFSEPQNLKLVITEANKEFKVKPKETTIGNYYYDGENNNLRKSQGPLKNKGMLLKSTIIPEKENDLKKSKLPERGNKKGASKGGKVHQLSNDFNPGTLDLRNSTNAGISGRRGIGISS